MEKKLNNILIYGFGRMGLTHYAILNGITPDLKFTVMETNKKLVFIFLQFKFLRFINYLLYQHDTQNLEAIASSLDFLDPLKRSPRI